MDLLLLEPTVDVEASTRREFIAGAAALSALVFAGCGDGARDGGGDAATRTLEDAFGETSIPADPQRIIADSVITYAHLVSLGITPVAVALPAGISAEYVSDDADEMTNVVSDDGWTVDVEEALAVGTDLIVAVGADYNLENCDRYREAVATFAYLDVFETNTDQDIKDTLVGIAMALGREDEAAAAIAAYDERVVALTERIAATDLVDRRVGVVRIDVGGFIGIRTDGAGPALLNTMGLTQPEWPAPTVDGYVELSLETLEILDETDILLVNTDDDVVIEDSVVFRSPLWSQLAVVREERAHFVGAWNGGDLPQMERVLDDIERTLVEPAESST